MRIDYNHFVPGLAKWAVVNTHPHRERLVLEHLERQDYWPYCPMTRRRARQGRRYSDVLRPLFPNYVFVKVPEAHERWRPILSTIGVRSVVRCGDNLSYIDDHFIRALRSREIDGVVARAPHPFQPGDEIVVAGGPFDGLVAKIVEMDEKDRLLVLMNLLNGQVKVKIEARNIAPLSPEKK